MHGSPRFRRPGTVLATTVLTATLLAVPATAGAATGTTSVALSGPAASGLKAQKVKLTAGSPAKATAKRLSLSVAGGSLSSGSANLTHGGSLSLKAGKRSARLTDFRVVLGKQPRVTARLGKATVTFATLELAKGKGAKIDVAAKTVRLTGATATLPAKTAKTLAKALKLRKLSAGRLGTLAVTANLTAPAAPAAPAPSKPAPAPAPPTPAPPLPLDNDIAPPPVVPPVVPAAGPQCPATAPVGAVAQSDWVIRKSFVDYLYTAWPGPGPTTTAGVFASDGAVQGDPASRYGWCFGVTGATTAPDGTLEVQHEGTIAFVLTAHYLDIKISDPRIEIAPNGLTGRFYADGQGSGTREDGQSGNATPDPFTNQHLLDLTFDGTPTAKNGTVVYHVTSSKVANARAAELLANEVGEEYGKLNVTVPPAPAEAP